MLISTNAFGPQSWMTDMPFNRLSRTGRTYGDKILVAEGRAEYVPGDQLYLVNKSTDRLFAPFSQNALAINPGADIYFDLTGKATNEHWRSSVAPFHSLRFMDWTKTNHSKRRTIADLTHPDVQYLEGRPGPDEWAIAACLETGKGAYNCIGHLENAESIRHRVRLWRDSGVKVRRWEFSNEWWNSSFGQFKWFRDTDFGGPLRFGSDDFSRAASKYLGIMEWVAEIVKEEDPEAIFVMSGWAAPGAGEWWTAELLYEADLTNVDEVAIAPYYESEGVNCRDLSWVDRPIDEWNNSTFRIAERQIGAVQNIVADADNCGVKVIFYEWGSHVNPITAAQMESSAFLAKLREYHEHPWQANLIPFLLDQYAAAGVTHIFTFRHCEMWSKHTFFGWLEMLGVLTVRYTALCDWIKANAFDPADINQDGVVDNGDIQAFIEAFKLGKIIADFNRDGVLDNGDVGAFIAELLKATGGVK